VLIYLSIVLFVVLWTCGKLAARSTQFDRTRMAQRVVTVCRLTYSVAMLSAVRSPLVA